MRNVAMSVSACVKTGMCPLKYVTWPSFFMKAKCSVMWVAPIGELTIDEPQLRDHHLDVSGRRLSCPPSYAQGRLPQLTDHMGRVETAYAITLENTSNGRLAHA